MRDNCVIKSCSSSIDAMMRRNKRDGCVLYIPLFIFLCDEETKQAR